MSDLASEKPDKKRDEVLRKMLNTPPEPHSTKRANKDTKKPTK